MTFATIPLTPDNLKLCASFWADRRALTPDEFAEVLRRIRWLLTERRAIGTIVLADEEPRSYGVSAFVEESAVEELLASHGPQLGSRLLLHDDFRTRILDHDGIARRNASGQGLQLLVLNVHYRPELGYGEETLGLTMKAFIDLHQGYRLARVLTEVFGDPAIDSMAANGSFVIHGRHEQDTRPEPLRSQLGIITRESAMRGTVGFLPMFVYAPPQVHYTRSEQELLTLALAGGTDDTLRRQLGVTLTAVKSRWLRIQQRTAARVPHLFADVAPGGLDGRRGAKMRHVILEYVRRHPSELTPYDTRHEISD